MTLLSLAGAGLMAYPELSPAFLRRHMPRAANHPVTFSLLLDDDGRVMQCDVLTRSVSAEDEAKICAPALGEKAGKPATGPDGEPVYGMATGTLFGSNSRNGRSISRSALLPGQFVTVSVAALPDRAQRAQVAMIAYFDENGKVVECTQGQADEGPLFAVACAQSKGMVFPTVSDTDGRPVGRLESLTVIFEVDEAA